MGNYLYQLSIVFISNWHWFVIILLLFLAIKLRFENGVLAGGGPVFSKRRAFLIGSILYLILFTVFSVNHFRGYNKVRDLEKDFEALAMHDYSSRELSNQSHQLPVGSKWKNADEIIVTRNHRLAEIGLCTYGPWTVEQNTGEPPVVNTDSNYYWCGHYGNGSTR